MKIEKIPKVLSEFPFLLGIRGIWRSDEKPIIKTVDKKILELSARDFTMGTKIYIFSQSKSSDGKIAFGIYLFNDESWFGSATVSYKLSQWNHAHQQTLYLIIDRPTPNGRETTLFRPIKGKTMKESIEFLLY